jgi:hypothetical protein
MSKDQGRRNLGSGAASPRAEYSAPRVQVLGDFRKLTALKLSGSADGGGASSKPVPTG